MGKPKFSYLRRTVQHESIDAYAVGAVEVPKRLLILAVHVKKDECCPTSVMLIGLFKQRLQYGRDGA